MNVTDTLIAHFKWATKEIQAARIKSRPTVKKFEERLKRSERPIETIQKKGSKS